MKIIVLTLFILEIFIGLTVVIGNDDDDDDPGETEEETKAERDTYVSRSSPDSNYGGDDRLKIGGSFSRYATYIYFDFDDEPDDWDEVEISLYLYDVDTTTDVLMFLASSEWEELMITYNTRPGIGRIIETFKAASEGVYKFDVSDVVEDLLDDDEDGISICLNISSAFTEIIYMWSEEGAYYADHTPQLIWTYQRVPDIDYGLIIFIILIIAVPAITASVLIILYFTKWRKKAPRKPVVPPTVAVAPTQPRKVQPSPTPSSIKNCASCGRPLPPNAKEFCPNCGKKILQEAIKFCPNCGNKVPSKVNFCEKCGKNIE